MYAQALIQKSDRQSTGCIECRLNWGGGLSLVAGGSCSVALAGTTGGKQVGALLLSAQLMMQSGSHCATLWS